MPSTRMEMDESDRESLLNHGDRRSRPHIKHYDRMDSWTQLVKTGSFKFLITVIFGGVLCLCLRSWEGFGTSIPLSDFDVRIFNALTIAISICLGLNLLASLKRYAIILRWSILTKSYVSMEVFDLILGIDELTNVTKLFFLSIPGLRGRKWLMGGSRLRKNTKSGTNGWYPFMCLVWLFINIGSQILVASLSLFWPMEPYQCQLTKYGNVSLADLSRWIDETDTGAFPVGHWSSQEKAWRYGMDAQSWKPFLANESKTDLSTLPGTPFYQGDAYYEYRFFYRNPTHPYDDYSQTNRSIQTRATCDQYVIDENIDSGALSKNRDVSGTLYDQPQKVRIPTWGTGMISYIVHTDKQNKDLAHECGLRCARFTVLQLKDELGRVNKTSLWSCKNIVSKMDWSIKDKRMDGLDYNITRINGTDDFAGIAAGAISWSGIADIGFSDRQWRMYPQGTPWSPDHKANTTEIQDIIMRHTIRAIAAFDDHGIPYNIHINDRNCDKKSQRLNVGWRWIAVILGSIILIQLVALCYLLAFANRTIIRDASHFSTAMLLKPVLKVLDGESGAMAMSGAELKSHPKLQGRKIWYDYIEGRPGEAKEVTVSFEDEIKGHKRKKWGSGEYR